MKNKKILIPIIVVFFTVVVGMIVFSVVNANSLEKKLTRKLDLGNRYLQDGDYEQAIAAFDEAIKIDPHCVEAYVGIANTYVAMTNGADDSALVVDYLNMATDVLKQGYEITSSESILSQITDIDSKKEQLAMNYVDADNKKENVDIINTVPFIEDISINDLSSLKAVSPGLDDYPYLINPTVYDLSDYTSNTSGSFDKPSEFLNQTFTMDMNMDYDNMSVFGNSKDYYKNSYLIRAEDLDNAGNVLWTKLFIPIDDKYDLNNHFIEAFFNSDNEYTGATICHYSDGSERHFMNIYSYDSDGYLYSYSCFVAWYYSWGKCLLEVRHSLLDDETISYEVMLINQNGMVISLIWYDSDYQITGFQENEFDENGNIIKRISHN